MFYTFVTKHKNNIHYFGYHNGKKIHHQHPFEPYLCFKDNNGDTESIYGDKLKTKYFSTITEFNKFRYANKDILDLYADIDPAYQFLYEKHKEEIEYDLSLIRTWWLDIETPHDKGFPSPEDVPAEIKSIAIYDTIRKEYLVLGLKDYESKENTRFKKFRNEKELLRGFIKLNHNISPDIWIAHNGDGFDFPYIVNRIKLILGNEYKELSPINKVTCKCTEKLDKWGNLKNVFYTKIEGISLIDNLALYKKYVFAPRASYALGALAEEDLGDNKLNYEEYDNLFTLYEENYQLFIDYNIKDVAIMVNLNNKHNYLRIHQLNTYRSKCKNFNESMAPTRLWDSYLNYSMMLEGKQTIAKADFEKFSYPGAFVMHPPTTKQKWVVSLDLDSLYPHIQMEWEISPENIVKNLTVDKWLSSLTNEEIEDMIHKENNSKKIKFLKELQEDNIMGLTIEPINQKVVDERMLAGIIPHHPDYIMSANGFYFKKTEGIMPRILKRDYAERKVIKKAMNNLKAIQEQESHKTFANEISSKGASEKGIKIMMNAGYGAFGSEYFRYYSYPIASSITMNGQLVIKWLNKYFVKEYGDLVKVIYNDTDSAYVNLDKLVIQRGWNKLTENEICNEILNFVNTEIADLIKICYDDLAEYVNGKNFMSMKCEKIMSDMFWTGKKHYAYRCLDDEGVRYKIPKFGYTGLECIKSSTPKPVKKAMKEVINTVLTNGDIETALCKNKFSLRELSIEELSTSKTVNGIKKYSAGNGKWKKGAQAHLKSALIYNQYLKDNKLVGSYPKFIDGDKIKYFWLLQPNPYSSPTFGYVSRIPKDEMLRDLCDKNLCVEKAFGKPMIDLLEKIGITLSDSESIEDLF